MKSKLWALALAATVPAGLALAEPGDENVGQIVYTHEPVPVAVPVAQIASNALTNAQTKALNQGRALRPGVYGFRSLHSGLCLSVTGYMPTPPLYTHNCGATVYDPDNFKQKLVVLPHPAGGYTVRLLTKYGSVRFEGYRPTQAGEIGDCLTVARGVLIGAARIEARACDVPGSDWTSAGSTDQRFFINTVSPGTVQVSLAEMGDGTDCWVLRDNGRTVGTEVIRWQCNRTPDQLWQIEWLGPVPDGEETRLLEQTGWYRTPSGHSNILGAEGLDLTGPVYSSFDTANDSGDYCRKRCAELDQCKAWTWTGPGYVVNSSDPPRCYWKSAAGDPINRGPQTFGKLRSGIVRP